jgi:hypothetical protein
VTQVTLDGCVSGLNSQVLDLNYVFADQRLPGTMSVWTELFTKLGLHVGPLLGSLEPWRGLVTDHSQVTLM